MIEKERKFLLKYLPDNAKLVGRIQQGYIMLSPKKQLRVRIYLSGEFGNQAFMCYKSSINKTDRLEFEYEIPLADAKEMYNTAIRKLEKTRFYVEGTDHYDIDIYDDGLQVCEIEYTERIREIPDFCGKEITGVKKYSNINLAK